METLTRMSTKDGKGPWRIDGCYGLDYWYIKNDINGTRKKIGPVGGPRGNGRGINYRDRAMAEAERRNYAYWRKNPPRLLQKDIIDLWRLMDQDLLELTKANNLITVGIKNDRIKLTQFEYQSGKGWIEVSGFTGFDRVVPESLRSPKTTITIKLKSSHPRGSSYLDRLDLDTLKEWLSAELDHKLTNAILDGGGRLTHINDVFEMTIKRGSEQWS